MTRLCIVAMQHHDFQNELTSLYQRIVGQKVVLRCEDDNPWDPGKAVAAYFENRMLGYITSDRMKMGVRKVIASQGRPFVRCTIKRFVKGEPGKRSDMLEARLDTPLVDGLEDMGYYKPEDDDEQWQAYEWKGCQLPQSTSTNRLQAVVDELYYSLLDGEQMDDNLLKYIDTISQLSWADMSREMQQRYDDILRMLTSIDTSEMNNASDSMMQIITHVGSPEVRTKVYQEIINTAQTDTLKNIALEEGYTIESLRKQMPDKLYQLLASDPQQFVARVWYLKMPRRVLRGMMSATVFLVRCMIDADKKLKDGHLPIRERTMKVGQMMDWSENLTAEQAHEFCRFIMLSNPMLSESDLKELSVAFHVDIPKGGVVFKDCQLTGNNITEQLSAHTLEMPVKPHKILLTHKQ